MSKMVLEVVTPERKVYEREIDMVIVQGVEGELGILPNHIPFVTPLRIAPLTARRDGEEDLIAVNGGFMEVRKDRVVILAESAELPEEIDVDRAQAARDRAQRRIQAEKKDDIDYLRAEIALQKAINRLKVSGRMK